MTDQIARPGWAAGSSSAIDFHKGDGVDEAALKALFLEGVTLNASKGRRYIRPGRIIDYLVWQTYNNCRMPAVLVVNALDRFAGDAVGSVWIGEPLLSR